MSGTQNENSTGGAILPFNQVPAYQLEPGTFVEVQPSYNNLGLLNYPSRILLIAQKLSTGSGTALTRNQVIRPADGAALGGAGSMADQMVNACLSAQGNIPTDLMLVADAGGATKAAGTFTVGGSWTAAGTFPAYVAGVFIGVGYASTDSPTAVATNLAAAINAYGPPQGPALPVTATSALGVVTCTARHGGLCGNDILLEVAAEPGDSLAAGMTGVATAMTGGATNPTMSSVISAISEVWYTDIACPWQDEVSLQALAAELERRYGAMVRLDGDGYAIFTGSFSTIQATKAYVNEGHLAAIGATGPCAVPWAICAALCGVAASAFNADPARQLLSLSLPGIIGPRRVNLFTDEERELLLEGGVGTFSELVDGTMVIQRLVTTYLTNAEGVPDPSWMDIMTSKVMSRVRYDWRSFRGLQWPRNKLAPDGSIAAQYDRSVATPRRLKGSWMGRCRLYEQAGWLTDMTTGQMLAQQAVFVIDPNNRNRVLATQPVRVIGNLMTLADIITFQA